MKINKLTASFGKLENETLTFHEGLNVIHAPNESGKSTWCAFIRAMLYGVDSSERAKGGFLPDKQRYAPWSGAAMEGTMDLTADRCDITLQRSTKAKGAPMREFSATYTGSNIKVEGLTGTNAGEQLTGVTRDVFRRSAFIEQGSVAVSSTPDLERRINAIVSTGEEGSSYSEADERLRAWQRKRRYNRRGMLPELEAEIDESRRLIDDMSGSADNIARLELRLERTQSDCERLESAVTESRKQQRREALETLNRGRTALSQASQAHDDALAALGEQREELRRSPFAGQPLAAVEQGVQRDLQRMAECKSTMRTKNTPIFLVLFFLLSALGAWLYTAFDQLVYIIGAGVMLIGAIFFLARYMRRKQAITAAADERRGLLKKYRAMHAREVSELLERYRAQYAALLQAQQREHDTLARYEQARVAQNKLEENALSDLDFVSGSSQAALLGRELAAKRGEVQQLTAQIATLRGRLSAMGDPMVLKSELGCMEERREQLEGEYEAITLALDTLHAADEELQSRFSPELGRVAAEYMARVTGGRYSEVLINRDFTALAKTESDTVAHDSNYLSAGTLDLLYLAVRLAVCKLALPEGEPCPLIIDDALVNLDETRLHQAMELLQEIAKERQVILFTCRGVG